MKPCFFLVACAALLLFVGGCALPARQNVVSQKRAASQPTVDRPYYHRPAYVAPEPASVPVPAPIPAPVAAVPAIVPVQTAQAVLPAAAKTKVAILLPLTGSNAALGQSMLNAAQQAVFDVAGNSFELQPRDTAASGGAEDAAQAAVAEGAKLIIGPLFAADVPSAKLVAQVNGLQMLPLSTDTTLADRGVYVMGLAPGAQVDRVIEYAVKRGAKRFAALLPASPYGDLVGKAFRYAVEQRGGVVVASEIYSAAAHDEDAKIKSLAGLVGQVDALFLPVGGGDLKTIADKLLAAGFDPSRVRVLGTGIWDVPDLAKQSPLLAGAWYAAPDPALRRNFSDTYKAAYGVEPPRLATLAYDATALAAVLSKSGGAFDEAALTNPNGFAGLDGIFRLHRLGEVERALAVNEATLAGAKIVDPAPTSFVAAK